METRVIGTAQSGTWDTILDRFSEADVYFLSQYHRAHELAEGTSARAFVAEEGPHLLFYPFLIRRIDHVGSEALAEPWFDIETAYGYTGPLSTTADSRFLSSAWDKFAAWCRDQRVVAEFVRFNPLSANQRFADAHTGSTIDRYTAAIDLKKSPEALWTDYGSGQRAKVRRAERRGLICEEVPVRKGLGDFRRLYFDTMDRVGAGASYYFPSAYFDVFAGAMAEHARLFVVRDGDRPVAGGLFLLRGDRLHYHLGGSDAAALESRPNNLLFHRVAEWGCRKGLRWLHLGGGRGPAEDDALLRFKTSIARKRFAFFTGRRVHNAAAYGRLCASWMQQQGAIERPNYFLLYRLEPRR